MVPLVSKRSAASAAGSTLPVALTVAAIEPLVAGALVQPSGRVPGAAGRGARAATLAPMITTARITAPMIHQRRRPLRLRLREVGAAEAIVSHSLRGSVRRSSTQHYLLSQM